MTRITKTIKTILFAGLIAALILPFSGMQFADAEKAPDFTDYKSMYEVIDKKIRENKKSFDADEEKIKDQSLSDIEISSLEKDIKVKKDKNAKLFEEADEIQRLNIESYKLDSETQQVFDDAEQSIRDNYLENGVYDLFVENKYRKVVVFVDPSALEDKTQDEADAFVSEIKNSVNVDVEVQIVPLIKTHATSCSSPTSACNPGKGGIQIAHSGSGNGSTLGFKAYHPTHGYGFIIAGHEGLDTIGTKIVQPDNGGTYGYVDVVGGGFCDCAFVDFSGHSMYDDIWAYDLSTIYPVGIRNTAATPGGTFIIVDGVGSTYHVGTITEEGNAYGFVDFGTSSGDSGAAVFQPQVDGTVTVYGIMTGNMGTYSVYEPYDYIKSDLGLTW